MKNIAYVINVVKLDLDILHTRHDHKIQEYINLANLRNRIDIGQAIEIRYITPNAALIIPFPSDMDDFVSLSLPVCGQLITLTVNDKMPHEAQFNPCTLSEDEIITDQRCNIKPDPKFYPTSLDLLSHWRGGQWVGEAYTYYTGHNFAGYVTVDYKRRVFLINGLPRVELCLQYTAVKPLGPTTVIKDGAVDVLRFAVHKQLSMFGSHADFRKAAQFGAESQAALSDLRISEFLVSYDQILDNLYTISKFPKL